MKTILAATAAIALSMSAANAATIIDNATQGYYNDSIGESLNGTNAFGATFLFPNNNSNPNDPTINPAPEPDLSAASAALGDWLTDPANLNANWSGLQAIPANWTVNSETAIVYEVDGGAGGLSNFTLSLGVDNGIFAWLNGNYIGGALSGGGAFANEYVFDVGNVGAGTNYLQILREDHGGGTGYIINATADVNAIPLPATGLLLLAGLGALAATRRRS